MTCPQEDNEKAPHCEESFSFTVDNAHSGIRLDQYLTLCLPEASRALIILSNKEEKILVAGKIKKSSYRLKEGEVITGRLYQAPPLTLEPQKVDFTILFEDDDILVISKPPGLVVHPGAGNSENTLVNGLLYHCNEIRGVGDDSLRPGIVHRLDKDTSGVMVAAKNDFSLRKLVDSFQMREVHKVYYAIVRGVAKEWDGRIAEPIGRHPMNRQKMAVCERNGKHAVSNWSVVEEFETEDGDFTLMRIHIETGRTHQIRVHMTHIGCPVAGDTLYSRKRHKELFDRQMLHASRLRFPHPRTGRIMTFTAPLAEDIVNSLDAMGWSGELGV